MNKRQFEDGEKTDKQVITALDEVIATSAYLKSISLTVPFIHFQGNAKMVEDGVWQDSLGKVFDQETPVMVFSVVFVGQPGLECALAFERN